VIILTDVLISSGKMACCVGFSVMFTRELTTSMVLVTISVSFRSFRNEVRFLA